MQPVYDTSAREGEPTISVEHFSSTIGVRYEKFHSFLDYQEERFLRRAAIERILRRKLFFGEQGIGYSLLQELVQGGYLANDSVPERLSATTERVIARFMALLQAMEHGTKDTSLRRWCISFAATEIHRMLFPLPAAEPLVDAFFAEVKEKVFYLAPAQGFEAELQTYLGCRRSLLKEHDREAAYALWLRLVPSWAHANTGEEIARIGSFAQSVIARIDATVKDSVGWKVVGKLKNLGIYYALIREVVEQYGLESHRVLDDQAQLDDAVRLSLSKKYKTELRRARRSGFRAVVYIFLTKILLAFLLEYPYDAFVLRSVDYLALGINAIFHPVLLLFMTSTISAPKEQNTNLIIAGIHEVLAGKPIRPMRIDASHRVGVFGTFLLVLYAILFLISFGLIITVLHFLNFNIVSVVLFLFFLTLVSYFGLRIRHNTREWKLSTKESGILNLLWEVLTLPIVRVGRWLSKTFSSINIFVLIMDFIIEAPLKNLFLGLDLFVSFLREKREEIH